MGLQHLFPVCYPACCRVLLLPQGCLAFNMDISVTSSCSAFPALVAWARDPIFFFIFFCLHLLARKG